MTPTVSVVIPNYNYASYLRERIESVLNQTYQDFELILLDDASKDNSVEILQNYSSNIHVSQVVVNEKNTGSPFKQWMKGIQMAKGEWIWIAEADDLAEPEFLQRCMEQAEANPNVSVCYAGSNHIDSEGKVIEPHADYWSADTDGNICCIDGDIFVQHKLFWHCCIMNASGAIFRKENALKLQNSPLLQMRYSGDWMFWTQMAMQGNVVEVRNVLNHFRQHVKKVSVEGESTGNRLFEDIDVVSFIVSKYPKIGKYKRSLRNGMLCRSIKKLHHADKQAQLYEYLGKMLGGKKSDLRTLHLNQYLRLIMPWLVTMKKDRQTLS